MGKHRSNKNATKKKNQMWKKGQSSSYNPQIKKHRDEAKKRAKFGYQDTNSGLTKSAVAQLNMQNANSCGVEDLEDNFDDMSIGGLSYVSTFSNCTNPSFNRLLQRWQSNSSLHKEMLAVLAAVTEVIKDKGGKETETEYFAALMTTLDIVENDEATTAVLSLLYMVIKRLPDSILKLNFSTTCPVLTNLLKKYVNSEFNAILRNLLGCLFCFLKAQESGSWSNSTTETYTTILECSIHHKPKVRKFAQDIVKSLLGGTNFSNRIVDLDAESTPPHPVAGVTSQFCIKQIEENANQLGAPIHHILGLMKDVMSSFPRANLKLCCESILKIMTLSDSMANLNCIQALRGMFSHHPVSENLPDELNVRLIKALYVHQPNNKDRETLSEWINLMEHAFINLYRLNPLMCLNHLPHFFKIAFACLLSDDPQIYPIVASSLKIILEVCIVPSNAEFQQLVLENSVDNPMCKIFHTIESGLSYQYHKAWQNVLFLLAACFDIMGKHLYPVMIKCLQSMSDLRDSFRFAHIKEIDKAFGAAIHRMGPKVVLNAVPLHISDQNGKFDFPRSWLLPILRDNIKETELSYFVNYFLPLASQLKVRVSECEKEKRMVEAKTYEVLLSQVWSLLPGFCTLPTDLVQSFKTVARVLGVTLNEQPSLRTTILSSIRILITKNLENEENREELSKFSKNYLPILFNLYTTESSEKADEFIRLAVFDTIKVYLQIIDKEICKSFFQRSLEKLKDSTLFTQHALIDLCKIMLPYVDKEEIKELYEYCKPLLQHSHHTIQKKSYGVINQLCFGSNDTCLNFVKENIDDLKTLLSNSLSSSSPPSKALRLNCLLNIVKHLSSDNKEFIIAVVPEATLCTKETAVKARTSAYNLLQEIGNTLLQWQPEDRKGAFRDYLQMLLAGFSGGPHMISATILAVGHVIYSFKEELDSDLINLLIENICLLLTSKSREILTSGMSFVKTLFSIVSTDHLAQHVGNLLNSLGNIAEDNQRASRFKAKELLTRLIRKFGYEMISKLAPSQFQKQLLNIRKIEGRKSREKTGSNAENTSHKDKKSDLIDDLLEDTDSEDDDLQEEVSQKNRKQTYIEEAENDIVDFMDPSTSRKILAKKPVMPKKTKSVSFETSEDGRIIIPDDKEEEEGKSRKRKMKSADDDKVAGNQVVNKGKKRKMDDFSDDDEAETAPTKYVSKGIHRTLKKPNDPGSVYKAKKAGGDVKRGKFEPYSYVPLNKQSLNKRKAKKLKGQFKGVVRSAKRGASKGSKQKNKFKRRR